MGAQRIPNNRGVFYRPLSTAHRPLFWAACVCLCMTGCAGTWDELTSHDFTLGMMFTKKDALVVLRDSNDGNERYKALAALKEPLQSGGSQQDQETIMGILKTSAT